MGQYGPEDTCLKPYAMLDLGYLVGSITKVRIENQGKNPDCGSYGRLPNNKKGRAKSPASTEVTTEGGNEVCPRF